MTRIESLEARQVLMGMPVISEILASNDRTVDDQDGDDSDYIELFNAGDEEVSLNRYFLTDDPDDLQKWRFPDVTLPTGEYMVVFASSKDRNDPDNELHTNFRLSTSGEFLALVEPDGKTIADAFDPGYPTQVTDVSYGVPTGIEFSKLIEVGAAGRILIPTDGSLDVTEPDVIANTWLDPTFDDSGAGWFDVTTGVGYSPPDTPVVVGDSVAEFSGVQGQDNWTYGVWLRNFDADGVYAHTEFTPVSASNFFVDETKTWDMGKDGAPPSTEITAEGAHPGTQNNGFFDHWAIRRWTSDVEGEITIAGTLGNADPSGDGVVGQIFVNGNEVFQQTVDGTSIDYNFKTAVALGDNIDFAINAGSANDEVGDSATFTATIHGRVHVEIPIVKVANSRDDWVRSDEQGLNNWYYGFYDRSADPDQTYSANEMRVFATGSWNSTRWEAGSEFDTQIRSTSMAPHAEDGTVHWVIRRWESTVDGSLSIDFNMAKATSLGDGVTARVFHNGVEVDETELQGDDRVGTIRTVMINGVSMGDAIDFVIDPLGPGVDPLQVDGKNDRTTMEIQIHRVADVGDNVSTSIRDQAKGVNSSAYLRIPFEVTDLTALDELSFRLKYDDGYIAYINGQRIASNNAPDDANYSSAALEPRTAPDATAFEIVDITDRRGLFVQGTNILQIHMLNESVDDEEMLAVPELQIGTFKAETDLARYFSVPTPGTANGLGTLQVGPLIIDSTHTPSVPSETDPLVITATVTATFNAVSDVTLTYQVMYNDAVRISMADDGLGQDSVAGDGTYTAVIPAGLAQPGEMIRWYVTARDSEALTGRLPANVNPNTDEQFLGTIIDDPSIESKLPVYHWFVEDRTRPVTTNGTSGSIYFNGEFYDNVKFDLHGQSSSNFPTRLKKSMNVDFPNDHRLLTEESSTRMEDINWLTNFADKSKLRNTLAYEQREMTGGGYHLAYPIRIQQNGEFFAVYDFVEEADHRWLDRMGLNPDGSLYKMYNSLNAAAGEKKNRTDEDSADLAALVAGVNQDSTDDSVPFIMDNVNIAQMANYLAGFAITANHDCCHKNYYIYRDTGGTNEWWFLPWDVDLTQGRNWGGFGLSYFDDTMYPNGGIRVGTNNSLISRLFNNVPGFNDMFFRRVRTLMDEYVKPPGTPREELPLETRVDELFELMKPDADLDNELHPAQWGQTGLQTFEQAVTILLEEYAGPRREYLYNSLVVPNDRDLTVIISGEPGAATGSYLVPTDGSLGLDWTQPGFDDSSWRSGPLGVGFEKNATNYVDLIKTDLETEINDSTSIYARIPFNVDDPTTLEHLTLRMKYDDGYVAYINGMEVNRAGLIQDEPAFDSTSRGRSTSVTTLFRNIDISEFIDQLKPGENILAIHGLKSSTSKDMFFQPELVEGLISNSSGDVPLAQVGNPTIDITTIDFNPASGNQLEEYVQLVNNNDFSVDISGWKLAGDIGWTFDPGTVLPAGFTLYAAADAKAFRTRTEGPTGGMGLFVQGNYEGQLPNVGGSVQLLGRDDQLVSELAYDGTVDALQEKLRISEIMYNPMGPSAAELAQDDTLISEDFEFIELFNTSDTDTLDLAGANFASGVAYDFTNASVTQLAPGERVLIVSNMNAFQLRYGQELMDRVAGGFLANTALRDNGERLTLLTSDGSIISDFEYGDKGYQGWPERADGHGSSLQIIDPGGVAQEPTNWRASREIHGSPGQAGSEPVGNVVINEVLSRPGATETDQVELFNTSNTDIMLENHFLSDASGTVDALTKFAIPNTALNAGAYVVFSESDFNSGGGQNGFALSASRGDELYLTVGDASGPTHFVDFVSFRASAEGESFGRDPSASGGLYPVANPTLGSANEGPRVGPVVITEVMSSPGTPSDGVLAIDPNLSSGDLEYVEITNPTDEAVNLTHWQLRLGADFDFGQDTRLESGTSLLVVPFNVIQNPVRLEAFRSHYGLNETVTIVGGYQGQLSSLGDGVQLRRPDPTAQGDSDSIPRLVEDEVIYDNIAPWPTTAVDGHSISRIAADAFGDDAANWTATNPTPGVFGVDTIGDLTHDGRVDRQDVEKLHEAALSGDLSGDLNDDGATDRNDMIVLVEDIMGTSIGDVNFDGVFDSTDLVLLFQLAEYEDGIPNNSSYIDGDWDLDGDFTLDDLMFSLQRGGYKVEAAGAPAAVVARHVAASVVDHESNNTTPSRKDPADLDQVTPLDDSRGHKAQVELASRDEIFSDFDSQLDDGDHSLNSTVESLTDDLSRPFV